MTVVLGDAVYAHSSSQYVRDDATRAAFSAGFRASRFDGSQFCDDSPIPWPPDLLSARRHLIGAVIAVCKEATRWAH